MPLALSHVCLSWKFIGEYQNIKSEVEKLIFVDCFLMAAVVDLIHLKRLV